MNYRHYLDMVGEEVRQHPDLKYLLDWPIQSAALKVLDVVNLRHLREKTIDEETTKMVIDALKKRRGA